jgi:hypothetical protein
MLQQNLFRRKGQIFPCPRLIHFPSMPPLHLFHLNAGFNLSLAGATLQKHHYLLDEMTLWCVPA